MDLRKKVVIKKLNEVYKRGYLPSRENESYRLSFSNNVKYYDLINCLAHACFNLNNDIIGNLGLRKEEFDVFGDFGGISYDREKMGKRVFKFIQDVGLKINPCHEDYKVKFNQWKIAVFYDCYYKDLHFMLQEKDGRWSSKLGNQKDIDIFNDLPKRCYNRYDFCGTFVITNPYLEKDTTLKNESFEEKE